MEKGEKAVCSCIILEIYNSFLETYYVALPCAGSG